MIRWLFIFLLVTSTCLASVDPVDEQLLKSAADLVDIRAANEKPFQLDIDFTARFDVQRDGHFTLKWASKDVWSRLITIGDFHLLEIRQGDNRYLLRNSSFTPLPVSNLVTLSNIFPLDLDDWKFKKVKRKQTNGKGTTCFELRWKTGDGTREICIDGSKSEVISDETQVHDSFASRTRKTFGNYQAFRNHHYPQQLKLEENDVTRINAKVISLNKMSFPDSTFVSPPGAIHRRECAELKNPEPVSTPDPAYPHPPGKSVTGIAVVAVTVLTDGSVADIQVVQSADPSINKATVDTVKTWKFNPAMCGTEPVVRDIEVEIKFEIRP
jgi:TonB family protein